MKVSEYIRKHRPKTRRKGWPRKRFDDGSLWILHPDTLEPVECIEEPDQLKKQWQDKQS